MAVPISSCPNPEISMLKLAREALFGDYNGSDTVTGPISLYDMINSGSASSGNTYPAVNTSSEPNPVTRNGTGSLELTNVTDGMGTFTGSLYYDSDIGNASNLALGDYLYLNEALSEVYCGPGNFNQPGSSSTTTHCPAGQNWYFVLNIVVGAVDYSKIGQSDACS